MITPRDIRAVHASFTRSLGGPPLGLGSRLAVGPGLLTRPLPRFAEPVTQAVDERGLLLRAGLQLGVAW